MQNLQSATAKMFLFSVKNDTYFKEKKSFPTRIENEAVISAAFLSHIEYAVNLHTISLVQKLQSQSQNFKCKLTPKLKNLKRKQLFLKKVTRHWSFRLVQYGCIFKGQPNVDTLVMLQFFSAHKSNEKQQLKYIISKLTTKEGNENI